MVGTLARLPPLRVHRDASQHHPRQQTHLGAVARPASVFVVARSPRRVLVMTVFAFAGRWESPPWWWVEIVIFLIFIWGSVGLFHGIMAFDRWLGRRKDARFDD
ncbi:hypothetical protein [Brytella acorum]|uniref:Uncharacterized protein n=1 Tax=Brytella acorum TaxID=2959299 RepID=A0AA35UJG9_9PROT|nr:hypothetical protein [Brytella acorum]CAI9121469.1 hypothetical protein LMG32879_002316 [Brytella acorum]